MGAASGWWRSCPRGGRTPSPLASPSAGNESKEAAKACMPAWASMADQRLMSKVTVACCNGAGADRAWCCARRQRNSADSWLHRPPTSSPMTTSRNLAEASNSGYVRCLFCRAVCSAAAAYRPPLRRGSPAAFSGDTRVVSMASWDPCHNGSPFAMTSMVRSSMR